MTDQPELQQALIPLAGKADVDVGEGTDDYAGMLFYVQENDISILLPGADGTLGDAEVTVVLGWLAKAGIRVGIEYTEKYWAALYSFKEFYGSGDTLNAALTAAVLALHGAQKAQEAHEAKNMARLYEHEADINEGLVPSE